MSTVRKLYRAILLALLVIIGIILTIIFLRSTVPAHGLRSTIITTWLGLAARTPTRSEAARTRCRTHSDGVRLLLSD